MPQIHKASRVHRVSSTSLSHSPFYSEVHPDQTSGVRARASRQLDSWCEPTGIWGFGAGRRNRGNRLIPILSCPQKARSRVAYKLPGACACDLSHLRRTGSEAGFSGRGEARRKKLAY